MDAPSAELMDNPTRALPLSLLINITNVQAPTQLNQEDTRVAGLYRVDLHLDAAEGQQLSTRASMALDIFHSSVAVAVLDDFVINVINPQDRRVVEPDPSHEEYSANDNGYVYKLRDIPL